MKLDPYAWYDPFALAEEAIRELQRAEHRLEDARAVENHIGGVIESIYGRREHEIHRLRALEEQVTRAAMAAPMQPFIVLHK